MRRTSARFKLIGAVAATAAAMTLTGVNALSGSAAEALTPSPLAANSPIGFGA
ncbi:hypothetical protein LUW77_03870 [Streptomyces radiopugnans]|nr:hypothetical protein LUW77_03870 [Streptomyces radiopugnans]